MKRLWGGSLNLVSLGRMLVSSNVGDVVLRWRDLKNFHEFVQDLVSILKSLTG